MWILLCSLYFARRVKEYSTRTLGRESTSQIVLSLHISYAFPSTVTKRTILLILHRHSKKMPWLNSAGCGGLAGKGLR